MELNVNKEQFNPDPRLPHGAKATTISYNAEYFSRLNQVKLSEIIKQDNAAALIESLKPQVLYHSLKSQGLNDSLEVLELITDDQFCRMIDYDCWQAGELTSARFFEWLSAFAAISPELMLARFQSLEEECQIAVFSKLVRVYTNDDYEKMSDVDQDRLYRFPNDALFYELLVTDPELAGQIEAFMEAAMGQDMGFAMNLVATAAMMPPLESEAQAKRFRDARLEEDGFVPYEESLLIFMPLDPRAIHEKWHRPGARAAVGSRGSRELSAGMANETLLDLVLRGNQNDDLTSGLLSLANALCAATDVACDDKSGLSHILDQAHGTINLALEFLAGNDVELAHAILAGEYPKNIYRVGLGLIAQVQKQYLAALAELDSEKGTRLLNFYQAGKISAINDDLDKIWLSVLGLEESERIKVLLARLPKALTSEDNIHMVADVIRDHGSLRRQAFRAVAFRFYTVLCKKAGLKTRQSDLDQVFHSAFLRFVLNGDFLQTLWTQDEVSELTALGDSGLQARVSHGLAMLRQEGLKSCYPYCQELGLDEKLLDIVLTNFLSKKLDPFSTALSTINFCDYVLID